MTILALALSLFALLLLSALFSGTETAVTATSRARIHQKALEGDRRAKILEKLLSARETIIGSLLIANNLVNILATALATALMLSIFGETGVLYATLMMTVLVVIFAEILPKTYALPRANRLALFFAPFLRGLSFLLGPITRLVQALAHFLMRSPPPSAQDEVREELMGTVALHHQEGAMGRSTRDMIGGVLNLRETTVGDIMLHRKHIAMVNANSPTADIVQQVLALNHSRIPLWKDSPDNVVGVMHVRDLLNTLWNHEENIDTLNLNQAIREPSFVPTSTLLSVQLADFRGGKNHFAIVVDEYNEVAGLITLEDILEEIVGDISDEHDIPENGPQTARDGSITVLGDKLIRDINRYMDWHLPDEATTFTGLLQQQAQAIPKRGAKFDIDGFRFEVMDISRSRIPRVRITPPTPEA